MRYSPVFENLTPVQMKGNNPLAAPLRLCKPVKIFHSHVHATKRQLMHPLPSRSHHYCAPPFPLSTLVRVLLPGHALLLTLADDALAEPLGRELTI